jgi:hypothetical protein
MAPRKSTRLAIPAALLMVASLACSLVTSAPPAVPPVNQPPAPQQNPAATEPVATGSVPGSTGTPGAPVTHAMVPPDSVPSGTLIPDVVSQDTAAEKRAPYGDSYDINRFERPFLQDMTYVPDLDIASFTVSSNADWWFVSVVLVGNDPNNKLGINYGVELDTNHDGFGDCIIWAHPPYTSTWDAAPVQIFQDTNHDTGGLSGEKSDAPFQGNGYDSLIFHGGVGDSDPDMAWVRILQGPPQASIQFAFKKSWSGSVFMIGPIADAGLKDPGKMDYNDRFTIADAGSPVRNTPNYPLKALFAVDNVCRAAFGFHVTGDEPQLCPNLAPPSTKAPHKTGTAPPPPPGIMVPP